MKDQVFKITLSTDSVKAESNFEDIDTLIAVILEIMKRDVNVRQVMTMAVGNFFFNDELRCYFDSTEEE